LHLAGLQIVKEHIGGAIGVAGNQVRGLALEHDEAAIGAELGFPVIANIDEAVIGAQRLRAAVAVAHLPGWRNGDEIERFGLPVEHIDLGHRTGRSRRRGRPGCANVETEIIERAAAGFDVLDVDLRGGRPEGDVAAVRAEIRGIDRRGIGVARNTGKDMAGPIGHQHVVVGEGVAVRRGERLTGGGDQAAVGIDIWLVAA
jgi:hypothetical protein